MKEIEKGENLMTLSLESMEDVAALPNQTFELPPCSYRQYGDGHYLVAEKRLIAYQAVFVGWLCLIVASVENKVQPRLFGCD